MTSKPASFDNGGRAFGIVKRHVETPRQVLPGALIPGGGDQSDRNAAASSRRLLGRLRKALRQERCRGKAGHWSYDLNRHIALAEAHKSELSRVAALAGRSSSRAIGGRSKSGSQT